MAAYKFVDHAFDVVVVGAGGSGLRAALGCAQAGLKTACVTKVFPTRSHTVAAQGGISAALGNMGQDDWRWHMYDTVKGSDWLGDQDAIEYLVRNAPDAVYELEHWGVPFSPHRRGQDLPARLRRHDQELSASRRSSAPAPPPTAPATPSCTPLYGQSLKNAVDFYIEYFVLDLIMDDGVCRGVTAWKLDDGTLHRFSANLVILATGGYGRAYFSLHLRPHLHRRRRRHGAAGRPAPAGHGVRAVPSHRHLRRGRADHRRGARRGRLPHQFRGRAVHGALCPVRQGPGLPRRGLPLHDHRDPRRPGRGPEEGPYLPAPGSPGSEDHPRTPAPASARAPRYSPAWT